MLESLHALRLSLGREIADLLREGDAVTPYAFQGYLTRADGPIATALAEAEARGRRQGLEWQPIETAPKDGTRILLFGMERVFLQNRSFIGRWDADRAGGCWVGPEWRCKPTLWMPLPPDPPLATTPAETQKPEKTA